MAYISIRPFTANFYYEEIYFKKLMFKNLTPSLLIIICTIFVYINSVGGKFVSDDIPMLVNNDKFSSIKYLPDYFLKGVWDFSTLETKDEFLYRPLVLVSFFVNFHLWGENPLGFHIINLLLHIGNSILVYLVIKRVLQINQTYPLLIGALFFAVHPVHVEAVSWIQGVVDLLSTFFILGSFLFYLRFRETCRPLSFMISISFFILSLLTKETAVVMPVLILLYDYIKEKKIHMGGALSFFCLAVFFFVARAFVLDKPFGTLQFSLGGVKYVLFLIALFIKFIFLPFPLGYKFEMPHVDVFILLFAAVMTGFMIYHSLRHKQVLFFTGWFFIFLMPVLLLAFYARPIFSDRFLYLPSVGIAGLISVLISSIASKNKYKIIFIAALLIIASAVITINSNKNWKNDEVFYSKAIENSPHYGGAYTGLAKYHERQGQYEKALNIYFKALNNLEESSADRASIYDGIAFIYGKIGLTEESILFYRKELEIDDKSSSALVGLGNNYWSKNDYKSALQYYHMAFSFDNKNYEACFNLALLYEFMGENSKALQYYAIFVEKAPPSRFGENIKHAEEKLAILGSEH